ncbi:MAG: RsmE family RNA methyltransferase [Candidatus Onthovivens sp.]|nr:16S rRNA (uracil(1498)-N(3))-methyltransferase [Mollicutes bacterium]MDY4857441.1 RsmE family RNA methyltransferase [Candidatus Onthovivens sp.]
MQRYFTSFKDEKNITISNDDIFHIVKVMRMKINDQFEINNDGDIYLAQINSLAPFSFKILKKIDENHELKTKITLLYCLPKGDKIDLVLQKATELGVNQIVLVNSSRCIAKINDENKKKKLARFNKIIKEATEQCKRNNLPALKDVIKFNEISNYQSDLNLIAYENSKMSNQELKDLLRNFKGNTVTILIGAEGGFSKEEVEHALKNNFISISLGNRILRSETSVFNLLSILGYELE